MSDRVTDEARSRRWTVMLLAGASLCYLVGYPLAIVGKSDVGWIFVALGGPFLLVLGILVVRRIHLSSESTRWNEPPSEL